MAILGRFIDAIVKDYESEQDKVRAREVFEDAKRVVLYGAPEPSFTAASDKEMFGVMIAFVRGILKDYPNPDYARHPLPGAERQEVLQAEDADRADNGKGDRKDVEMEGSEEEEKKKKNQNQNQND